MEKPTSDSEVSAHLQTALQFTVRPSGGNKVEQVFGWETNMEPNPDILYAAVYGVPHQLIYSLQ